MSTPTPNAAVRAARRGTAVLCAIPTAIIVPLILAILWLSPAQNQARVERIKQAWAEGGPAAVDTLSSCMRQVGFNREPPAYMAFILMQSVEECEATALRMAKVRRDVQSGAEGPTVEAMEQAIDARQRAFDGLL